MIEEQLARLQLQIDLLIQEVTRLRAQMVGHVTPLENRGWSVPPSDDLPNEFPQGVNSQG